MSDDTRNPQDPVTPNDEASHTAPAEAATVPAQATASGENADAPGAPTGAAAAPPARAKRSIAVPVTVALVVGAVLGGATGGGIAAWSLGAQSGTQGADTAKPQSITVNDPSSVNAVTAIAAKAAPSVVTIDVSSSNAGGTGSGVILDEKGNILTNNHVITLDGATANARIGVTLADGSIVEASIVGTDPTMDLAVIRLKNPPKNLTPISFGDSSKANVGDQVVAIGAPLGLANTVTEGIVSALNRSIEVASSAAPKSGESGEGGSGGGNNGGNNGNGPFDFWNFGNGGRQSQRPQAETTVKLPVIQTDAAINPGNSGGALVNSDAKLIGINVAIASTGSTSGSSGQPGSIGVGFAIPSDVAERIAGELIQSGNATHGLLGASVTDATAKTSTTAGARIAEPPVAGGAASAAGIQKGDVVTRFDGHPVRGAVDLTAQVRALAGGAKADLTYVRDGRAKTVSVTLGTLDG